VSEELDAVYDNEEAVILHALADLVRRYPFSNMPTTVAVRMLGDYERMLQQGGMTREEAESLALNDLRKIALKLRTKLLNYAHIGPVRSSVLLHAALFLGYERVDTMRDLFDALKKEDYERAQNELLLSAWPSLVGDKHHDKLRVLDLARQLRTGEVIQA